MTMVLTSLCWYAKPTIATSTKLHTKDARSIEDIRAMARASVRADPERLAQTIADGMD